MEKLAEINKAYKKIGEDQNPYLEELYRDEETMDELRRLGVAKEEVSHYFSLLSSYRDSKKECVSCKGLSYCPKEMKGMQMKLTINDSGRLSYFLESCPFAKERISLMSNYFLRDFPDEWLSSSLKSFQSAREKNLKKIIARALSKNSLHRWVYLYGKQGGGKSYALAAFANDFARLGHKVAYIDANKRFDELKTLAIKDKESFEKTMKGLGEAEILVIDDFGSEYKSDYVRDQIVLPLLNDRAKKNRITLFSSDYSLNEIEELYGAKYGGRALAKRLSGLIKDNIDPQSGEYEVEKGLESLIR